jgi:coenzyme Q-binding protein COQ10
MPIHHETRHSPYTPEQLAAMILDIERYPEFLPWCRAARITARDEDGFTGELVIRFHHLTERYSSRVIHRRLHSGAQEIDVTLVKGPFKHLTNHWRIVPRTDGADIYFHLDFAFKSKMLERVIGGLFTRATEKMTQAFLAHADALYGKQEIS